MADTVSPVHTGLAVPREQVLVPVGVRVREARLAAGLTQEALAVASGVHRVSISKLERGLLDIGVVALVRIAGALSVDAGRLLP